VRELDLDDRIDLEGRWLLPEEVLATVRDADCGVVPNLPSPLNDLTLSAKLLDYVSLGIPAVVARLEVQAAHFDDTEVTFFEPGNARSLADAVLWVAANPAEARSKAERAQRRVAAYAWPRQRDAYLRLLSELTGEPVEPRQPAARS
jgi:glycosyltransferase involved in cell wall biosynthesis